MKKIRLGLVAKFVHNVWPLEIDIILIQRRFRNDLKSIVLITLLCRTLIGFNDIFRCISPVSFAMGHSTVKQRMVNKNTAFLCS